MTRQNKVKKWEHKDIYKPESEDGEKWEGEKVERKQGEKERGRKERGYRRRKIISLREDRKEDKKEKIREIKMVGFM